MALYAIATVALLFTAVPVHRTDWSWLPLWIHVPMGCLYFATLMCWPMLGAAVLGKNPGRR